MERNKTENARRKYRHSESCGGIFIWGIASMSFKVGVFVCLNGAFLLYFSSRLVDEQEKNSAAPRPAVAEIGTLHISANRFALRKHARIAQLVEHSTDTRKVLGSTPSARTAWIN
jgi:hypothetical protein